MAMNQAGPRNWMILVKRLTVTIPPTKQVAAGTPHHVHGSTGDPEYGFDDVSLS